MDSRSYARIEWVDGRLGLRMVNQNQQSFFLFAEPLLMLQRKPYVLVKYADRNPERCIRRHGGEIWAGLDSTVSELSRVRLFFIQVGRRIQHSPVAQLENVLTMQDYVFPVAEIDCFTGVIGTMLAQRPEYDLLKMDADTSAM